jgi:phage baseplate assembly protein V
MSDPADIQRLIGDIGRLGTIVSVDLAGATCRLEVGEIVTGDLPWLAPRAGTTRIWSPPSIGEQCLLLCPEGDTNAGIILPGIFSDARPAPSDKAELLIACDDGARIGYDPEAHALTALLPAGATARIEATGGITLVGDVTLEGKLTATGDVVAAGVSLQHHKHAGVSAGGALSGEPA